MTEQPNDEGDGRPSLREWIKRQAEELDVAEERLLFNSKSRDPMWIGTDADHRNGQWFAEYWRRAVERRSDDRVHVRGVHYVMIEVIGEPIESPSSRSSWDYYRNTTTCYSFLKDASVAARVLGYVPLDGIIDNDNEETILHPYGEHTLQPDRDMWDVPYGTATPDVPDIGEKARFLRETSDETAEYIGRRWSDQLKMDLDVDRPSQQPFHIEIWSEKTPPGIPPNREGGPTGLHALAMEYGVNLLVTGTGDLSYQVAYNLSRRINRAEKPGVILYLSDYDPKGDNMAKAMAGKLSWLDMEGHLDHPVIIEPMAVTAEQIERYGLPRSPIDYKADPGSSGEKAYETLVDDWEQRKGYGATELQALWGDEDRFLEEVETFLEPLYDDDLGEDIRTAINEWRDEVSDDAAKALKESELPEMYDDVQAWIDDFNDVLDDIEDAIEDLNRLTDDDERRQDWIEEVTSTIDDVELPDLEPPEGEAYLPDDPLYDSRRSYFENIQEIRRHEVGDR